MFDNVRISNLKKMKLVVMTNKGCFALFQKRRLIKLSFQKILEKVKSGKYDEVRKAKLRKAK